MKCDIPPLNSLKDSNTNSKVKTVEEEKVGVRSLACNTSRVRRVETKMNDNWVNYSYAHAQTKQQVG
jgi:hypothetical protein